LQQLHFKTGKLCQSLPLPPSTHTPTNQRPTTQKPDRVEGESRMFHAVTSA